MPLILLILQIISAIPTIIKIIKMIMDLLKGLPVAERRAAETQLRGILKKHIKCNDPNGCHAELDQFHRDLVGKYGDIKP